jgi:hypothetical protein
MKRPARAARAAPWLVGLAVMAIAVVPLGRRPPAEWGPVPPAWLLGLELLRAGAHAEAAAALASAEDELESPPPALLQARLHAALLAKQMRVAEFTAEKLAVAGDADAMLDFVRGLAAYERARAARFEAEQPGADPTAFDRGMLEARRAAAAFQRASLAAGGDWPAARRNAERALVLLADLERKKQQREQQAKRERDRQPPPDPDEVQREEHELPLDDRSRLLTAAELEALLDRLAEAEQEKRALRREAQRARSTAVERDW